MLFRENPAGERLEKCFSEKIQQGKEAKKPFSGKSRAGEKQKVIAIKIPSEYN